MTQAIHSILTPHAEHQSLTLEKYHEWYKRSLADPEGFWAEHAKDCIRWMKPWQKVLKGGFDLLDVSWFDGGKLNAADNCLDKHLAERADQLALLWEGDAGETRQYTYAALHKAVCQLANVYLANGIKKGDCIGIYMSMIPEVVVAMLAAARIGAIHTVVFGGFSAAALKDRLINANCKLLITADESKRGGKIIPLKANVDEALVDNTLVKTVLVVKNSGHEIAWVASRDKWYADEMQKVSDQHEAAVMDANDPLFILYTSGSTGTPKGILHDTGGYMVFAAMTFKYLFDYRPNEVYWCTADVGWITGHTYGVYGPLANGATILLFEGIPTYPNPARYWQIIEKYRVNIFYTAPTAIRALRREGDEWVQQANLDSLRLLGSVGEPINPDAWEWYYQVVGQARCPIIDTWWQTETGGIMISAIPGVTPLKPGSAAWPFFGVYPSIVDDEGHPAADGKMGQLLITQPWPGMMKTVYGDKARYVNSYFKAYPGRYLTGDQAYRDNDGYYWISGRSDDVIKVSGHRIGTQEVESALQQHPAIAEAAVVAIPDTVKGQAICACLMLKPQIKPSDTLKSELIALVKKVIGAIAIPEKIYWVSVLPKTRSGKILRRLLRKLVDGETENLGDLSTLADAHNVDILINEIKTQQ